jgi:hypothetical protein
VPSPFDSLRQQSLVNRANSADSPGQYLSSFGNEMAKELSVLEINKGNFLCAKFAHSFAPHTEPLWTWHNSSAFLP